jgi:hypothetical protein
MANGRAGFLDPDEARRERRGPLAFPEKKDATKEVELHPGDAREQQERLRVHVENVEPPEFGGPQGDRKDLEDRADGHEQEPAEFEEPGTLRENEEEVSHPVAPGAEVSDPAFWPAAEA